MIEMPTCGSLPDPISNPCSTPATISDSMIGITGVTETAFNAGSITRMPATCVPTAYKPIVSAITTQMPYMTPTTTTPYGSGRDSNGLLTDSSVTSVIGTLGLCINVGSTFAFTAANINMCNTADSTFIAGVQIEFNYYYALYIYAIRNLVAVIQCPTTSGTTYGSWTSPAFAVKNYTNAAIVLNTMVNDIIYIMDQVAQKRTTLDVPALTRSLNLIDQSLTSTSAALQTQRNKLTTAGQNKMILMKDMESYSRQKAKYHNNMLMVYSFLNITALGLLFYIYRST
jgi:hypothetical protein